MRNGVKLSMQETQVNKTQFLAELYDLVLNFGFNIKVDKKYASGCYDLEVYKGSTSKKYRVGPDFICMSVYTGLVNDLIVSSMITNKNGRLRIV